MRHIQDAQHASGLALSPHSLCTPIDATTNICYLRQRAPPLPPRHRITVRAHTQRDKHVPHCALPHTACATHTWPGNVHTVPKRTAGLASRADAPRPPPSAAQRMPPVSLRSAATHQLDTLTILCVCSPPAWRILMLWSAGEYRARMVVKRADVGSLFAGAVRAIGAGGDSGIFCFFKKRG
jgi:hypothetical protein